MDIDDELDDKLKEECLKAMSEVDYDRAVEYGD